MFRITGFVEMYNNITFAVNLHKRKCRNGRRARFRFLCGLPRVGSSPIFRINNLKLKFFEKILKKLLTNILSDDNIIKSSRTSDEQEIRSRGGIGIRARLRI